MTGVYTTAEWIAKTGHEEAFVEAWHAFATWAHTMPGAGTLRLAQDLEGDSRFVSFGSWGSIESAHRWKADPEFRARMSQVQEHVATFTPSELQVVRVVGDEGAGADPGKG
ncbi:MAG: antibiotic biosynthesis monooxygenase family protein [Nocardioides sp.]